VTDFRLVNRWLALAGGVLNCALTLYIWVIVGGAKGLADLWLALAQCLLLAAGGYFAAALLLRPGSQERFGRLALLLPVTLWAITFLILIRVALGYWSRSPMLAFELMLPMQSAFLALGGVIFELLALLSRYLTSRSTPTPPAAEAPPSAPGERRR
jgi:hypothetical protein